MNPTKPLFNVLTSILTYFLEVPLILFKSSAVTQNVDNQNIKRFVRDLTA